jgi:hypothetical protein
MAHSFVPATRIVLLSALVLGPAVARAEPPKLPVPAVDQSAIAQRGYFYVGGPRRRPDCDQLDGRTISTSPM